MASRLTSTSVVVLLFVGCYLVTCANGKGVMSSRLQKRFLGGGQGETQNIMVSFNQDIQQVFDQINSMNFTSDTEKRTAQTNAQKTFTEGVQSGLKSFLNTQGVQSESFWIANKMIVPNANSRIAAAIANFPGVARVEEEPVVNINLPFVGEPEDMSEHSRQARQSDLPWGIRQIRANHVWEYYNGRGVVVANIDTGVRYTHETLRANYRSDYGWFDPYRGTSTPNDGNGHGTHTMGTIAGTNGIGVAPGATWIACKGCDGNSCGGSELLRCGEWIQCPTRPNGGNADCSKAPKIVSNSWGGGGSSNWYDNVIKSWRNSGIIPVFSIGNSGPNCNTAGSPGERSGVIGVGSTDENNKISRFSSLGPARDGRIKPDIAAPGGNVRSAWHTGDRAYNSISGTSMACPHVSGVIALMYQRVPYLNYDQVYKAITDSAWQGVNKDVNTCGRVPGTTFPNNVYGYGEIDAIDAVNAAG